MDDLTVASLTASRNEWATILLTLFTPRIQEGIQSIFVEAVELCKRTKEPDNYLLTFQTMLVRIPRWDSGVVDKEYSRIIKQSRCTHIEDIIACIHIIQLKILTAMRVGNITKKIDIDIPDPKKFLHSVYKHCAVKLYKSAHLFEQGISPIEMQKNMRTVEEIIQACILAAVRDAMPVDVILKEFLSETTEDPVGEPVGETVAPPMPPPPLAFVPIPASTPELTPDHTPASTTTFSDTDIVIEPTGLQTEVVAPKDVETLEQKNKTSSSPEPDDVPVFLDNADISIDELDITNI